MLRETLLGAAAGAAGATALNVTSYADMLSRGRAPSTTPERTVERLLQTAGADVPGDDEQRTHRVSALGALSGLVTGVAVGGAYGLSRALGLRPSAPIGAIVATVAALAAANVPMTRLGITDPRTWSAGDWVSDIVPHLAYGIVTAATYAAGEHRAAP